MRAEGCVLAMGTFDGVHRGHRAVLAKAAARAGILGVPSLAMAFRRPPRFHFSPVPGPILLTSPAEKEILIRAAGVDGADLLTFGKPLARLAAEEFFRRYVLRRWRAREVVVGYNFVFGRGRGGDPKLLTRLGRDHGISVHVIPRVTHRRARVSSGVIRDFLRRGDLSAANVRLGHPYLVRARVRRGDGRGRLLGFPTANLAVPSDKILPPGVFAVRAALPDGRMRGGMANVGVRPTLARPDARPALEVHLFGFSGSLVGKSIDVFFLKKLREERKFPSLDALKRQLSLDARAARAVLSKRRP